jgi:hypothetical protein
MAIEAGAVLAGTAAPQVAAAVGSDIDIGPVAATADIATYARLAAAREPGDKPKPLYLRGADAKPQAGFILPRQGHDRSADHGADDRKGKKQGSGEKGS